MTRAFSCLRGRKTEKIEKLGGSWPRREDPFVLVGGGLDSRFSALTPTADCETQWEGLRLTGKLIHCLTDPRP